MEKVLNWLWQNKRYFCQRAVLLGCKNISFCHSLTRVAGSQNSVQSCSLASFRSTLLGLLSTARSRMASFFSRTSLRDRFCFSCCPSSMAYRPGLLMTSSSTTKTLIYKCKWKRGTLRISRLLVEWLISPKRFLSSQNELLFRHVWSCV